MTEFHFRQQFKILTEFFDREHLDYAVIGAFALHAYGYTRATTDVDFITRVECQDKIVEYLESLGFETLNRSEGYSNHLKSGGLVRIDVVYIGDETADLVFSSTRKLPVFENVELPIVSPEHLIALKLFAIKNDPGRKFKELSDIKEIMQRTNIAGNTMRGYFKKYDLEEYYDEVARDTDSH